MIDFWPLHLLRGHVITVYDRPVGVVEDEAGVVSEELAGAADVPPGEDSVAHPAAGVRDEHGALLVGVGKLRLVRPKNVWNKRKFIYKPAARLLHI